MILSTTARKEESGAVESLQEQDQNIVQTLQALIWNKSARIPNLSQARTLGAEKSVLAYFSLACLRTYIL